jgi:hypothetical protein
MDDISSSFIFDTELTSGGDDRSTWGRTLFDDPTQQTDHVELSQLLEAAAPWPLIERALCNDARLRDVTVTSALLLPTAERLAQLLGEITTTEERYRREAVSHRMRLDTLQKINATEPNPALRYPQRMLDECKAEISRAERDLARVAPAAGGAAVLKRFLAGIAAGGDAEEQALRAFGLAWRGRMRLAAWRANRRETDRPRLVADAVDHAAGIGVPDAVLLRSCDGRGVILELTAAQYCLDLMWLIAALASEKPAAGWYPTLTLPRVIIELVWSIAYELPSARPGFLVDGTDPDRIWVMSEDGQSWQPAERETAEARLERVAAESARMVAAHPEVLAVDDPNQLALLLARTGNPGADHRPYLGAGVASQLGPEGPWLVIEALGSVVPNLAAVLGGEGQVAATLAAYLLFRHPHQQAPSASQRARLLARLWRSIGRLRPVGVLGPAVAAQIGEVLQASGESSPDRPSFYAMAATQLVGATGDAVAAQPLLGQVSGDFLGTVVIADQLRLTETINKTWGFASSMLDALQAASTQAEITATVRSVGTRFAEYEEVLRNRVNPSWINSDKEVWSLLRGRVPVLWDFWSKVLDGEDWQSPLAAAPPEHALGVLLRLFGDLARLVLVVEVSSPTAAERLAVTAERSCRALLSVVRRWERPELQQSWPALRDACEPLYYYFDESVAWDPWGAFVRRLEQEVDTARAALESVDGAAALVQRLQRLGESLESLGVGPLVQVETVAPKSVPAPPVPHIAEVGGPPLTEQDAIAFHGFYVELLGCSVDEPLPYLKAASVLRAADTRGSVHYLTRLRRRLAEAVADATTRQALLGHPAAVNQVCKLLVDAGAAGADASIAPAVAEYLAQAVAYGEWLGSALGAQPALSVADQARIRQLEAGASLGYSLLAVASRPYLVVHDAEAATTGDFERLRRLVHERLGDDVVEEMIAPFGLAGGFLSMEEHGLVVSGTTPALDLTYQDIGEPASNALFARHALAKARLVRQLLASTGLVARLRP